MAKKNKSMQEAQLSVYDALDLYRKGIACGDKQDFANAALFLSESIKLDPTNKNAFTMRGIAYGVLGRYEKAIDDFSEVLRMDPNNKDAYLRRSRARLFAGDIKGAESDLARGRILK